MYRTTSILVPALGAAGIVALLAGCATQEKSTAGASSGPVAQTTLASSESASPGQTSGHADESDIETMGTMAFPTGRSGSSVLAISKGLPEQVRLNQPFEYDLTVRNLTDLVVHDVVITDAPSAYMKLSAVSAEGRTAGDGSMVWVIGDLQPNGSKTVRATAVAGKEGNVGTCTSVTYTPQLCTRTLVVEPELMVTKTGPSTAMKCEEVIYEYEVCNPGSGAVTGVVITDDLPEGLLTQDGKATVRFESRRLAPGECETFTARLQAQQTGTFEGFAVARDDSGLTAQSSPVQTMVRQPVLTITKDCKSETFLGRPLTMDITVTNTGDGPADNVVLRDTLPADARFVQASGGATSRRDSVTWNLGSLLPQQSRSVTLEVEPRAIGNYRSTATVTADCAGTAAADCTSKVSGIPAILLEVVDLEDPIAVGDTITYVITVTNQGTAPDTNIRVTCDMEEAKELVSATGASYTTSGHRLTFVPLPSLAPKEKAEYRLVLRAIGEGDVRFKVTLTSDKHTRPIEETESTFLYR